MNFLLEECPTQASIQRLSERASIETNYQARRKENYVLKCWEQTKIVLKKPEKKWNKNIATGKTSQGITPFHFFNNINFHH